MRASTLEQCSLLVKNTGARTIALQFPDDMLDHAHDIVKMLETGSSAHFYILADSPYSECCVDYVAAKHIDADLIVHFGNVCDFSVPPGSVPVIFMIPQISRSWDTNVIIEEIHKIMEDTCHDSQGKRTLVIWGMEESYYFHENVSFALKKFIDEKVLAFDASGSFSDFSRNLSNSPNDQEDFDRILFVGEDGPFFSNIQLRYFRKNIYILSPDNTSVRHVDRSDLNRMITKRYHVLSKVSNIEKVGIVVADVSSHCSRSTLDRIRRACISRDIQPFVISVGKITEAKLANISGLDFYVLVSCPYVAAAKLCPSLVPLVTPYEFNLLLNDCVSTIFTESYISFSDSLSFTPRPSDADEKHENVQMIQANIGQKLSGFCERTFTGLQIDTKNRDLDIHDGSFGIASNYANEPKI